MGIFTPNGSMTIDHEFNKDELLESFIYDEISRLSDEKRQEFVNSEAAQVMVEAGLIGKKTLVKLSKNDDLERRMGMAALQLAKDSNDILFDQLTKVRLKERELLDKINKKYEMKAAKAAKIGQKEYLKGKIPVGFMRK